MATVVGSSAPADLADSAKEVWAKKWRSADTDKTQEVFRMLREKRHILLHGEADPHEHDHLLSAAAIRQAARSFSKGTAVGADHLTFAEVASMPEPALEDLSTTFRHIVAAIDAALIQEPTWASSRAMLVQTQTAWATPDLPARAKATEHIVV